MADRTALRAWGADLWSAEHHDSIRRFIMTLLVGSQPGLGNSVSASCRGSGLQPALAIAESKSLLPSTRLVPDITRNFGHATDPETKTLLLLLNTEKATSSAYIQVFSR
jgi:DNA-binding helix-hairpin-helix protein with protein kinase domain